MVKRKLANQKGLTLMEILAAIVIITLIILFLGNLLPLMARTNEVNEKKIEAIHLANEQLIAWQEYFQDPEKQIIPKKLCSENGKFVSRYPLDNSYHVVVTIYPNDDYQSSDISGRIKAHQIRVQIYDEQNDQLTETYGYIFTEEPLVENC